MFQQSIAYCAVCDRQVEPDSGFLWDNRMGQAAHLCTDCLEAGTRFFARTRLQLRQRTQGETLAKRLEAINAGPVLFVLQDEPQATPPQWIRDSVAGTEYDHMWD
jgi:hypothetical protein